MGVSAYARLACVFFFCALKLQKALLPKLSSFITVDFGLVLGAYGAGVRGRVKLV